MQTTPLPRLLARALVLVALALAVFIDPVRAQFADAPASVVRGVIVVKTRALPSEREPHVLPAPAALAMLRSAGLRSVRVPFARGASSLMSADRHGLRRIFEVTYDGDIDARALAARLEATGEIEYAEPVPVRSVFSSAPNDSAYAMQYALQLIDAEGAWGVTHGDSSVVIGIVDTGLDWEHEDLAANIWRNPGEIPGNGVDDDGNGFVDDIRGWDFIGAVTMDEIAQGIFREDNDPKVRANIAEGDIRNHGTHVGGIVAATGDNGLGIAGVAYGCRLMPVKTSSDSTAQYIFRGYEGILYCARSGADVVNCSWGGTTSSKVEADVVAEALDLGCVVVAASGNNAFNLDELDFYPALIPGIVSVGASGRDEGEAYFSNHGVATTVFAPGVDVLSTVAGNLYASKSGTSMASPVVAGVAALVRSVHPDWTPAMVLSQLRSTSDSVLRGSVQNRPAYFGRVNARRAVTTNGAAGSAGAPGITLAGVRWLDAAGDTTRHNGVRRVAFTLRNNLATARALSVVLAPIDQQIAIVSGATTSLDSLGRGATTEVVADLQIAAQSIWYAGTFAMQIGLRDTAGYTDYLIVHVPFELPSRTSTVDLTGMLGELSYIDVDSPSPDVAWLSGYPLSGPSTIVRIVDGRMTSSRVPLQSPRVHAIDSLRCLIRSGAALGMTEDGGKNWSYVRIDSALGRIDQLLLFSSTEWCAVGQVIRAALAIPYAYSSDAGMTWQRDTIRLDSEGAKGFVVAAERRGRTGLIAMAGGGILRTDDAGRTWENVRIDPSLSVARVALWSETRGMLIAASSSAIRVATTSDGGMTWSFSQDPLVVPDGIGILATPEPGGVSYMPGRTGSIVAIADGDVRRQIPSIRLRTRYQDASVSVGDSLVRIWHVGPVAGYIDISLRTSGAAVPDRSTDLELSTMVPIPARDHITVRVDGTSGAGVTLEVIDLLGRTLLTRALDVGGSSHTVTLPLESIAPGRYLLRVRDGEASIARSFVVE